VENFGWNFSANHYSEPQSIGLSSAALVTAAQAVQVAVHACREDVRRSSQYDVFGLLGTRDSVLGT